MLQVERSRDGHSIAPGGFRERRRCLAVVPRHILGERGIVRSPLATSTFAASISSRFDVMTFRANSCFARVIGSRGG